MSAEEKRLLERAKRGDSRAMDTLLAEHEMRVYRFALRMCGSEEASKEVLQQTLITAFQSLHAFRGDAQLSTWLYQIARSFCSKSRRKRVDEPEHLEPSDTPEALSVASEAANPEDVANAKRMGEVLEAAILALPERYREALILKDVEGLTAEEAAKALGIEVTNLKTRVHRARAELRANLSALLDTAGTSNECAGLSAELSDFAANDIIEKATCEKIEAHLSRCERCAAACESLKRTVSLCRRIPGDEVPAAVRAAVRQGLQRALMGAIPL